MSDVARKSEAAQEPVGRSPESAGSSPAVAHPTPEGWKLAPIKPTAGIICAIVLAEWKETRARGLRLQRELGLDVIGPNSEQENAAGLYELILEAIDKTPAQVMAEVRERRTGATE